MQSTILIGPVLRGGIARGFCYRTVDQAYYDRKAVVRGCYAPGDAVRTACDPLLNSIDKARCSSTSLKPCTHRGASMRSKMKTNLPHQAATEKKPHAGSNTRAAQRQEPCRKGRFPQRTLGPRALPGRTLADAF